MSGLFALAPDTSEDKLYRDPELAQFYDLENGWGADLDYCCGLARNARSVLDLGCGTGLFLSRVGDGRTAVGVDPAAAMLDVARQRSGGDKVTWVEADARTLRLDQRFELIVLTGHAFQVFLTEADQQAVLGTIARHLAPDGRFIFDSRNPSAEEWPSWGPEQSTRSFQHPRLGRIKAWNEVAHDVRSGIVTYETHYRVAASGQRFSAASNIRFSPQERLAALLDEAGLTVDRWLGDWSGKDYTADMPEIIPLGRLR